MLWADVPYPDTLDALAEALRHDPVIVQQILGEGDAAGADTRMTAIVDRLPFKAYVALVKAPADAADEKNDQLATALSRRIGRPGLYIVATPSGPVGLRLVGTSWNESRFNSERYRNVEAVEKAVAERRSQDTWLLSDPVMAETMLRTAEQGEPVDHDTANLSRPVVAELVARELDLQPYDRPDLDDEDEGWTAGKRWMVGTATGAGSLALLLHTLTGWWPGWRRRLVGWRRSRARATVPDITAIRTEAGEQVARLATALPDAPAGPHQDAALLARELAEPLLGSSEPDDVVGALVLARYGQREVARAGDPTRGAYRPCFFDPRHREASQTHAWRFGETMVAAPVCRACATALARGRSPQTLGRRRLGRWRPYYERRTVWARTGFGALVDDLPHQVALDHWRRS
ncbi:MAG: hypothetical protein ACXVWW_05545 [Nocardioides sp.]